MKPNPPCAILDALPHPKSLPHKEGGSFVREQPMNNRLYYGDNLEILRNREYFPDECVDLIYLDPPFNSNRNYNVLFKSESGRRQRSADHRLRGHLALGRNRRSHLRRHHRGRPAQGSPPPSKRWMNLIERNQMMAYLVMMSARLVEAASRLEADRQLIPALRSDREPTI